jgi:proton translocating ATP synthase F1 alpha subunit
MASIKFFRALYRLPFKKGKIPKITVLSDDSQDFDIQIVEYGVVSSVSDGVIQIIGLNELKSGELVYVGESKVVAMVLNLEEKLSKGILFGNDSLVSEGDTVVQADSLMQIGVNTGLLGRVVDSLGNMIDGGEDLNFNEFYAVDIKAPGIISRKSVHESMPTGIKTIDSMLPIGNGQRELIIGDRQTGKTSVAIDAIINQQNNELQMVCIYVGIGQKKSSVSFLVNKLNDYNSLNYTIFVLAGASDAAALQFLSPYSGCAIGE